MNTPLECPVCLENFRDAVLLIPCGHSLCSPCVKSLALCPECRQEIESIVPNYAVRRANDAAAIATVTSPVAAAGSPTTPANNNGNQPFGAAAALNPQSNSFVPNQPIPTFRNNNNLATTMFATSMAHSDAVEGGGGGGDVLPNPSRLLRPRVVPNGVFFFDKNGRLCEYYYNESKDRWGFHDHCRKYGASAGFGVVGAASASGPVVYRSLDRQKIMESTYFRGKWRQHCLSDKFGFPHPASDLLVASGMQMFYRSSASKLVELQFENRQWIALDHGVFHGTPYGVAGRVFGRDADGSVLSLAWNAATDSWERFVVSGSCPVGRISVVQLLRGITIAYYRDQHGHVNEINVRENGHRTVFAHIDHSIASGMPVSCSDIVAAPGVLLYASESKPVVFFRFVDSSRTWADETTPEIHEHFTAGGEEPLWTFTRRRMGTCEAIRTPDLLAFYLRRLSSPSGLLQISIASSNNRLDTHAVRTMALVE